MGDTLTREILDKATADAGLPKMEWSPHVGTAEVQAMGRKICAANPHLDYIAAALPQWQGVSLAVRFKGGDL